MNAMRHIIIILIAVFFVDCSAGLYNYSFRRSDASDEFVIIIHGLRGESADFLKLEEALIADGYNVCRVDYPSTKYTIQALADTALGEAIRRCREEGADSLHFVAHSMGTILVRYYLQENRVKELGSVVFLSPLNHGTELVDRLAWLPFFSKYNGPGGMQLGADEDDFVQSLQPPYYSVGVIMSARSVNPIESLFIPGKDDGRVSIESAKLPGMKDFVLVNSNHHVVMKKEKTIRYVLRFLKTGSFH